MDYKHTLSKKSKDLIAYKENLLKQLEYYERRLVEVRNIKSHSYEDSDSSDSEIDLRTCKPIVQSITALTDEKEKLKTCLNATQELTGLTVLESELSVLNRNPGTKEALEPGIWREVLAECRVDLVPISLSFLIYQPHRKFSSPLFRDIRVLPVKATQEKELSMSVLRSASTPSEAYEVVKNYSVASRSRRTTLAKLAEAFATTLFMEPMDEGGYRLKCADLIDISWRLENNVSTVSPFQHKFKFNLEYIEGSYLKQIKDEYKQLSNPKLETDKRTLILAKILNICLEAKPPKEDAEPNDEIEEVDCEKMAREVNKKKKQDKQNSKEIDESDGQNNENKLKENQDPNSKVTNKKNTTEVINKNQKKVAQTIDNVVNNNISKDIENKSQRTKETNKITKKTPEDNNTNTNINKEINNTNEVNKETDIHKTTKSKQVTDQQNKTNNNMQKDRLIVEKDSNNIEKEKTADQSKKTKKVAKKPPKDNNIADINKENNTNVHDKESNRLKTSKSDKNIQKDSHNAENQNNKAAEANKNNIAEKVIEKASKKIPKEKITDDNQNDKVTKHDDKDKTNKEVKKQNALKRKAEDTNKVTEVKKLKNNPSVKVKTVTKSQSEIISQTDLVGKQSDAVMHNKEELITINSENAKNDKRKENIAKNNNKVKNTEGNLVKKDSKLQSTEKNTKTDTINKAGNTEPTKSDDKIIREVVQKNKAVKNIQKTIKPTAINKNNNSAKSVIKDKRISTNLGNNKLKSNITKRSNTNLPLKMKKLGNINKVSAGNTVQSGISKIPQKKISPYSNKLNHSRKSPRSLTEIKKAERNISNIPRIIKPSRPK